MTRTADVPVESPKGRREWTHPGLRPRVEGRTGDDEAGVSSEPLRREGSRPPCSGQHRANSCFSSRPALTPHGEGLSLDRQGCCLGCGVDAGQRPRSDVRARSGVPAQPQHVEGAGWSQAFEGGAQGRLRGAIGPSRIHEFDGNAQGHLRRTIPPADLQILP